MRHLLGWTCLEPAIFPRHFWMYNYSSKLCYHAFCLIQGWLKSLFLSLFFYWMASQSSHSITSLMDFIECCTFLYLYYTTSTYLMCWGLSFLYINKFLFTYQNKIYVYHTFLTASGWSDDNAYCRPWNNSCRSYLGCFPACTSMILHYQLLIQHCKFHENGFSIHALPWLLSMALFFS